MCVFRDGGGAGKIFATMLGVGGAGKTFATMLLQS